VLLSLSLALAEPLQSTAFVPRPLLGRTVAEVRGGVEGAQPLVCAEVAPHRWVSLEGCGSGAGFVYPGQDVSELVHFRAEATLPLVDRGRFSLLAQPGLGFAELEAGADAPGFLFGEARSVDQREAAGPELSGSLKVRAWPHERFHAAGELSGGAAWMPAAPTVLGEGGPLVPFVQATIGLGL